MPRGIVRKEGKFFESRLIQKLFGGKLSQQRSVSPQCSSSDRIEQVSNKFLSEIEPGFFEVENTGILYAPGYTEGRLMFNSRDSNMSKWSTNAWGWTQLELINA